MLAALIGSIGLSAVACVEARRRAAASVDDYAAYRRFRTAKTVEERLAASYEYLREQPHGAWSAQIRRWSVKANAEYLKRVYDDLDRLKSFLHAVPHGPQSDAVASRIAELELDRRYRRRKRKRFDEKVSKMQRRLAAAQKGRDRLVEGVVGWVARLSDISQWGGRTHELDHELIHAYRLTKPEARCTTERCKKTVSVEYAIPENKKLSPRLALYDVVLELRDGGVVGAMVTGPELFNRLTEALELRPIAARDYRARTEALGRVTLLLSTVLESRFPMPRCSAEAVSPVLLHRACDGVQIRVIAAIDPAEEDRIVIEPVE